MRTPIVALAIMFAVALKTPAQLQPGRTLILIGPPASGKTVQADLLRKQYKIPAISIAELLEHEVNRNSSMGRALGASMTSGELLSDAAADEMMKARLMRPDAARGFILDGYPATEVQAKSLDRWISEHNLAKPFIIVLNVPEEVSRDRIARRKRADDAPANVERRLRDYREVGRLVEQWYGPARVVRVDGTGTPAAVALRIQRGIDAMQAAPALTARPSEGLQRRDAVPAAPEQK
jgi:adenylate kinase